MIGSPSYSLCKLFHWVLLSWAARTKCANIRYPLPQCESKSVSHSVLPDSATPWTLACQVPLSMEFSRQEYWSGVPFSSPMHARMLSRFSRVQLYATPWTAAHQAPLSTGFSRQEHWSGLPFPSPMHACMLSHFSHVRLCSTPWTAAHKALLFTDAFSLNFFSP